MEDLVSVRELAESVNAWCDEHGVSPASGQAGVAVTERNVRYYRSLGLLDPPLAGGGQGFGEKHRLQLVAVKLLQAQGLPLNRIGELLFGRTVAELRRIESQGLAELNSTQVTKFEPSGNESWGVTPLDGEFMLISRSGRTLPAKLREQLIELLNAPTIDDRKRKEENA